MNRRGRTFLLASVVALTGLLLPYGAVVSSIKKVTVCEMASNWGTEWLRDFDACSLRMIYEKHQANYPQLPALVGFKGHHYLDDMIQFWVTYWRERGYVIPTNDPLLIKSMIAVESSFRPRVKSFASNSSAYGLLQITNSTRKVLTGVRADNGFIEIKKDRLHLTREDLEDLTVSVAAGIRWLAHKYQTLPSRRGVKPMDSVKYYHSWDRQGEQYLEKVSDLYHRTKLRSAMEDSMSLLQNTSWKRDPASLLLQE